MDRLTYRALARFVILFQECWIDGFPMLQQSLTPNVYSKFLVTLGNHEDDLKGVALRSVLKKWQASANAELLLDLLR